jgi:hypothetical protein
VQRNVARSVFAGAAIVSATALMWSDTAITWWSNVIAFALRVNESATTGILEHRPPGDADIHVLIWGSCALLLAYAVRPVHVRRALTLLFIWTVFVELAQPWFTQFRTRQATDLVGNCVGVLSVLVFAEIIAKVRARR